MPGKKIPGKPGTFQDPRVLLCSFYLTSDRAVNQLDISHRSVVTSAETALEDTQITTITCGIALAQIIEQFANSFF